MRSFVIITPKWPADIRGIVYKRLASIGRRVWTSCRIRARNLPDCTRQISPLDNLIWGCGSLYCGAVSVSKGLGGVFLRLDKIDKQTISLWGSLIKPSLFGGKVWASPKCSQERKSRT